MFGIKFITLNNLNDLPDLNNRLRNYAPSPSVPINLGELKYHYIEICNSQRKYRRLHEFQILPELEAHSLRHVSNMASKKDIWHGGCQNQKTCQAIGALSPQRASFSENVGMIDNNANRSAYSLALEFFDYFLTSPSGHGENLVHPLHTHHGVAVEMNTIHGVPVYFMCHTFCHWR